MILLNKRNTLKIDLIIFIVMSLLSYLQDKEVAGSVDAGLGFTIDAKATVNVKYTIAKGKYTKLKKFL